MARPEKKIDWKKVDDLLISGCHGTEIAPEFDMHVNTFYERVEKQYNMSFTDYSAQKRYQGDGILRHVQFLKAKDGDNTMLVWLGKNRLGQREKEEEKTISPEAIVQAAQLIEQINKAQLLSKERKIEETNSKDDSQS